MSRKLFAAFLAAAVLSMTACTPGEPAVSGTQPTQSGTDQTATDVPMDISGMFTDRDYEAGYEAAVTVTLSDEGSTADGSGVTVAENIITITQAGTYRLTGTLTQGQVRVSVGEVDKVQLVLDGASVANEAHAALYILSGDKVFVTLAEGSENALASSGEFVQTDENTVDAAVFSKSDVTFNGSGSLAVLCESGHGIVSKDDLKVTGGTYLVSAAKQGMTGKDSVRIAGGSFTVESGSDGLRSRNEEDTARGYLYIAGGSFRITAGNDGMDASGQILISGGEFTVDTGAGSASVTHSDGSWGGGIGGFGGWEDSGNTDTAAESCKGIKAGGSLTVSGGTFQMDTEDDAFHAGGDLTVSGGSLTVASGDDALHADGALNILSGTLDITRSYEGLEGTYITVSGGDITLTASDDGINAAGGNDGSGMAGPWGQPGGFGEATDASILISGGTLVMDAGGDGIDSNGDLMVTGGTVFLNGPTNGGNGVLDYAGEGRISGGTVVALGTADMAMNFGTNSTQGSILCALNGTAPVGTEVKLTDSDGNVLASYVSEKTFQSILISAPGVAVGETYTVYVGEASARITMESVICGNGMGGMGGPGGGPGGGRP